MVSDDHGGASVTLQSQLEDHGDAVADPRRTELDDADAMIHEPVSLFRHLETSGRFHRDSGLGRIFHPGRISFRENLPTESLHILIHGNRVSAHVDRVSPLRLVDERPKRYSLRRAAAHNIAGMAHDLGRLLRGRQGDHRCQLDCEWVPAEGKGEPDPSDLLDPEASAWSVHLDARVAASLDESRLRAAVAAVLGPRAPDHEVFDVVECPDEASLDAARVELQAGGVPVTAWPPLRVRLARHADGDVVMLNINHAASDGFAALRVLRAIGRAHAGDAPKAVPLDFLTAHELPVRPTSGMVSAPMHLYRATVERVRIFLARPARLAPDQPGDQRGLGFHLVSLSPEDTRMVVDVDRPGTSRNVLMAALHLAIGDWNLQHGTPGRCVGVLAPVNLRPSDWPEDTIGNLSVTARVSTSRRHRSGARPALRAVTAQTSRNKRTRTGLALIGALRRTGLLPLWAKQSSIVLQPLTRNRLIDTAMLSNLGWLADAPSFGREAGEVVEIWFSTPARAPLTLCIGAATVSGRLHLTFRYPTGLFSAAAIRRFTDGYLAHIRLVAESRS